jgi:hypothetical protein
MDQTIDRRRALHLLLGGAGLVALVGCSGTAQSSLRTDMVFSDGVDQQLPEISGVSGGLTAALTIPV